MKTPSLHTLSRVLMLGIITLSASVRSAVVSVNFTGTLLADNAISAWNGSFNNSTMDSRVDLLPFTSPSTGATRYTGNNPVNLLGSGNVLAGVYTRMGGVGTASVSTITGTTSAFGSSFNNYSVQTYASGSRLPVAGATGTLSAALSLPNGTVLSAGTSVYAELSSYVMDYNNPASFWYDSTTHLTHQVYENGTMDFYYRDGGGLYHPFASYTNSSLDMSANYISNTNTAQWSGTSTAVGNVLLPATVNFSNFLGILRNNGVITSELNSAPYVGFFGTFDTAFTANFDEGNALMVPEPSRAMLMMLGLLGLMQRRRRH